MPCQAPKFTGGKRNKSKKRVKGGKSRKSRSTGGSRRNRSQKKRK